MNKTNKLVVAQRADLVSHYVGETAIKTMEVIKSAAGGTLLIDECYQLVKEGKDFGKEALETLMSVMDGRANLDDT